MLPELDSPAGGAALSLALADVSNAFCSLAWGTYTWDNLGPKQGGFVEAGLEQPSVCCGSRRAGSQRSSSHEIIFMTMVIDLNADLGESPEALANGSDFELMCSLTSINIACGGHAGDAASMRQTLLAAQRLNLNAGAHPSYPDRANFGRVELPMSPEAIESTVLEQIGWLREIAAALGIRVAHVKPHGALYHAANVRREVALALGQAAVAADPGLIMVGQAGSPALDIWREQGLQCAAEAFADRSYEPDGSLRSRALPGAILDSPELAAQQALSIALRQEVVSPDGSRLRIAADTLCIHSDTPRAAILARKVRQELLSSGVELRPLGSVR
jgi:UPF0271 protein